MPRRRGAALLLLPVSVVLRVSGQVCEPFCTEECQVLNGDVMYECGACSGPQYHCKPGAAGFVPKTQANVPAVQGGDSGQVGQQRFVDPFPGCNSLRCTRVRDRQRREWAGADVPPSVFEEAERLAALPDPDEAGEAESGAYAFTKDGVEALESFGDHVAKGFGYPAEGAVLTEAHIEMLEREGYEAEMLVESGYLVRLDTRTEAVSLATEGQVMPTPTRSSEGATAASGAVRSEPVQTVDMVGGEPLPCSIKRVHASTLAAMAPAERAEFLTEPYMVSGLIDDWKAHAAWREPRAFAERYGHHTIFAKRALFGIQRAQQRGKSLDNASVPVAELVAHTAREHIISLDEHFGMSTDEDRLLNDLYSDYTVPEMFASLTQCRVFSFGGGARGVGMMQHGVAWLGLVTGKKLWHVAHPDLPKPSDRHCMNEGRVDQDLARKEGVTQCVMKPGETIFVPDNWWHSTCNLEAYTIGVGGQLWIPSWEKLAARPHKDVLAHHTSKRKSKLTTWIEPDRMYADGAGPSEQPEPKARAVSPPRPLPPNQPTPTLPAAPTPPVPEGLARGGSGPLAGACEPHRRLLGSLSVCPVLNGIWTSFLNKQTWGPESRVLPPHVSVKLAKEMLLYDEAGMDVWVGEDFDARVLSALTEHRQTHQSSCSSAACQSGRQPLDTIIVEEGRNIESNIASLRSSLGSAALKWVQLGPPALDHLESYRALKEKGVVEIYGVEDYTEAQVEAAHRVIGVETVQLEINAIAHPSPKMLALCERIGCLFVGYGPLLGGLLADKYLGAPRPKKDAEHREYFYTIDAWGGWPAFQKLLQAMKRVGDSHGVSLSSVAIAYNLALPRMLAVIVGVRLGVGSDHRQESIAGLTLKLSLEELRSIDDVVFRADPSCVSEECASLQRYRTAAAEGEAKKAKTAQKRKRAKDEL